MPASTGAMAWWRWLSGQGRRAFAGAFLGYALDSYGFWVLPLGLVAITAYFDLSSPGRPAGRPRWSRARSAGCWPGCWPTGSAGSGP